MSQTLATGTFQQVNFALEMLQNQMGNQRSHWMLIPGNTQNFTGHNPEKFHLLFKLALLWSGGWPRWPSEVAPNPNYSMILKTEKISVTLWLIWQPATLCCVTVFQSLQTITISTMLPRKSSLSMVQAAQPFSYRSVKSINAEGNGTEGQQWHLSLCKQSSQIPGPVFYKKNLKTQEFVQAIHLKPWPFSSPHNSSGSFFDLLWQTKKK